MSENFPAQDLTKQTIVYKIAGIDDVIVRRDMEYSASDTGSLKMDIYYPPDTKFTDPMPVVIFVIGYPGAGFLKIFGCEQKEMMSYVSWAKLVAASGIAALVYNNREPVADLDLLLRYVRQNADEFGINKDRMGLWACSGSVPIALSLLMKSDSEYLKCAVFLYGAMLDLDGSTGIAESAVTWGFANPCAGKSIEDISPDVPLFIARAGRDHTPHLNDSIDRFVARAIRSNLPLTFVNHASGPHWFDAMDDSDASREVIKQILAFMRFYLLESLR